MTYNTLLLFLVHFLVLSVFSPVLYAQQPLQAVTISQAAHYFNYTEFDDNGVELDKETGFIPGLQLSYLLGLGLNKHQLSFNIGYFQGQVEYDGQLQSGAPFLTDTDETLFNYGFKYTLNTALLYAPDVFVMLSQHRWDRGILGRENVSALSEVYTWNEAAIGFMQKLYKNKKNQIATEISALYIFNPEMEIDLRDFGFGRPELSLGASGGLRLQLFYHHNVSRRVRLSTAAYYEAWNFGRSANLTILGLSRSAIIFEPESETRHSGVKFSVEILF